ncbi:MAG: SEC-C metal-binding domain-containing protein, partial [Thermodesulfobacteriota bacterium]
GLRGYGQKNPLDEYKKEGFDHFVNMIYSFKSEVVERLFRVEIRIEEGEEPPAPPPPPTQSAPVEEISGGEVEPVEEMEQEREKATPIEREGEKIGRNDPCTCGSGKKYKKCCGA